MGICCFFPSLSGQCFFHLQGQERWMPTHGTSWTLLKPLRPGRRCQKGGPWLPRLLWISYCWWFGNPVNSPVEVGSWSVYPMKNRVWDTSELVGLGISGPSTIIRLKGGLQSCREWRILEMAASTTSFVIFAKSKEPNMLAPFIVNINAWSI